MKTGEAWTTGKPRRSLKRSTEVSHKRDPGSRGTRGSWGSERWPTVRTAGKSDLTTRTADVKGGMRRGMSARRSKQWWEAGYASRAAQSASCTTESAGCWRTASIVKKGRPSTW